MKSVPKPIIIGFFVVGTLLIAIVLFGITSSLNQDTQSQTLDNLNIKTGNPQEAGKNLAN